MDEEFGISARDVEAAEAETARKLAADRAVELESPKLGLRLDTSQLNLGILLDVYFHCTIGNLKLSLGFQVMKSTSLSWSFVYRNVRCGNEWTIDALRLKHKILISDVSSSST